MKGIKKGLAILLVLCTLLSMVVMTGAGTAESAEPLTVSAKPENGTTTGAPFQKGTGGSNSFRIPALVTLSNGNLVAAADARWNTTFDGGGLDTIVARSINNGETWNYTFANYLGDNGNAYNGSQSTAFIDPALAVASNDTIYMLCDLYPYGVALNGEGKTVPSAAVGFDDAGRLLLSADDGENYNYYLEDGSIHSRSDGTAVSGYTVDEYFNIKGDDCDTNLFFSDSPYKVVRTGYLYLTKSTNGGASWSAPTLIPNVKTASEQVCLVGPGRGLVTSKGTIVFPVYSYNNNGSTTTQYTSFISSSDGGQTWTRSASFTGDSWSSESAVVELEDGTLRFFYRNGNSVLKYVDYADGVWGDSVNTGIKTNSNTQISAITYSKTVAGKQVILVSCPTGSNNNGSNKSSASERLNGRIQVGLVNADNTMTWKTPVDVTSGNAQFMYSCLTELQNGSVAILYENYESGWGLNSYYTMAYATYSASALGLDAASDSDETFTSTQDVTVTVGGSTTITDSTGNYQDSYTGSGLNNNIATVQVAGTTDSYATAQLGTTSSYTGATINLSDCLYTFTASGSNWVISSKTSDGTTVYLNITGNSAGYPQSTTSHAILISEGTASNSFALQDQVTGSGGKTLYFWRNGSNYFDRQSDTATNGATDFLIFRPANADEDTSSSAIPGYVQITSKDSITSGGQYLIAAYYDGSYYVLHPSTSTSSKYSHVAKVTGDSVNTTTTGITITGVAVGTTSVVVGSTKYNINVVRNEQNITVAAGSTATVTDTAAGSAESSNPSIVTVSAQGNSLTFTGVADGTATVTTDTTVYTVTVNDGEPISIEENKTESISVSLTDGQYVEWTSSDSSYVGVAGQYDSTNGAYTNSATIIGHKVTTDPVKVTGTVYNADGSVASVNNWLVTVTAGAADTNAYSRYVYVNVTQILNCDVYYSINGGELIKINGTGVLLNENISGHFNIMFFAAPHEGYALTYMCVTGSDAQYYTLSNGNPDGTGSDAWPFNDPAQTTIPTGSTASSDSAWKTIGGSLHGFRWALLQGNMTIEQMKVMFSNAIALGCDGATNFTKNENASFYTEVQFVAQPLPTLTKEIQSITHDGATVDYEPDMQVEVGDTINYLITVERPAYLTGDIWAKSSGSYDVTSPISGNNKPGYTKNGSYGTITYSNETLNDALTGVIDDKTLRLGTSGSSEETFTYNTKLQLTMENFAEVVKDGTITNVANFSYDYKSQYSTGTLNKEAEAVADIAVKVPAYVIDFGLPVTIDLKSELGSATISSGTAKYGEVVPNEQSFTYKPTQVLKGEEYVSLTLSNSQSYAVRIYPATTVYYEEGFATPYAGKGIDTGSKGTDPQAAEAVGDKQNVYGYDPAYQNVIPTALTDGTIGLDAAGEGVSFEFTGTGVDIYTNSNSDTGTVMVYVYKGTGNTKQFKELISVDTAMRNGDTGATVGQAVTAYNVPIVSLSGLPYGDYTVEVDVVNSKVTSADGTTTKKMLPVYIDGFRVYGTLENQANDVYTADEEDSPVFVELRDRVLASLSAVANNSEEYADQIAKNTLSQVYATAGTTAGVVITSRPDEYTTENLTDLLDNGPKNEIYLQQGQALTFKITTNRVVQIGLKALNAATSCTINGTDKSLSASTDMFYTVLNKTESESVQTITITNNGAGILAITKLKVCDDPNATLGELTAEDLIPALVSLGYEAEPVEATATLNITVQAGGETLTTTLTATGTEGERHTFTAAEIQAAVETLELPEGYTLDGVTFEDVTVTCGEASDVSFTAAESPAPTPVSPLQKIIQIAVKIIRKIVSWF